MNHIPPAPHAPEAAVSPQVNRLRIGHPTGAGLIMVTCRIAMKMVRVIIILNGISPQLRPGPLGSQGAQGLLSQTPTKLKGLQIGVIKCVYYL